MPATKAHSKTEGRRSISKKRKGALEKARAAKLSKKEQEQREDGPIVPSSSAESSAVATPVSTSQSSTSVESTALSASARKLAYNEGLPASAVAPSGSTIVQLDTLQSLFDGLLCPQCQKPALTLSTGAKKTFGLSVHLDVTCTVCAESITSSYTSNKCGKVFSVNRQAVASAITSGSGFAGLSKFCEVMDMPVINQKTFLCHQKAVGEATRGTISTVLKEAGDVIRQAYPEQAGEEIVNIDVSYDGSWHTRGHTSNSGVGCVIENRTGLVVDFQVLSKYCHRCKTAAANMSGEALETFLASHAAECDKNHTGSSGSMEQKAAVMMWMRSEEKTGFRYRSVVCDGDSNTIKQINDSKPYDILVEKRECVNHVAKRLGTGLRKLVEDKKKVKVTLGGHGKGKLTQVKIGKLQKYYTRAIRAHQSVPEMKKAIWASFKHCSSTNEKPQHGDCPEGAESWCFYQRAKARGLPAPDHDRHMTTYLSDFVAQHMLPVYQRLTDDELLSRCIEGKTQNVNESIHSVIWARCPKHVFVGRQRLEVAVAVGVGEFNQGARATQRILQDLKLGIGCHTKKYGDKRDGVRKRKAERACENVNKRRREMRRAAQLREEQELVRAEGGEQYAAGEF